MSLAAMDFDYVSLMYDVIRDEELDAGDVGTTLDNTDEHRMDHPIGGAGEHAIGGFAESHGLLSDEIPDAFEVALKSRDNAKASPATDADYCRMAVDTIRRARDAGCVGDIIVTMQRNDPKLFEAIRKEAQPLSQPSVDGGNTAADTDAPRIVSLPYDVDPPAPFALSPIIYIGISNSGVVDMYANYQHIRNVNLYVVEYYGFTFNAPNTRIDVRIPLNEKNPPVWSRIGHGQMWLSGATTDSVRAGDVVTIVNTGFNHAMLHAIATMHAIAAVRV